MQWLEQAGAELARGWAFLTTSRVLAIILGVGFALLAIGLLIASRTKWGRAKPLTKFVAISVLLHVWLLMYAVGNRKILPQGNLDGVEQSFTILLDDASMESSMLMSSSEELQSAPEPASDSPLESSIATEELPRPPELVGLDLMDLQPAPLLPDFEPEPLPPLPPEESFVDDSQAAETSPETKSHDTDRDSQVAELPDQAKPVESPPMLPLANPRVTENKNEIEQSNEPAREPPQTITPDHEIAEDYELRQAPNRLQIAAAFGADADSEAAVKAGLKWLANAQSEDGSWNAAAFGAGTETYALNEYRHNTGKNADSAMAGLALLAFLSAGHTHLEGDYREEVRRGLSHLIASQMPSGDMSGPKQVGSDPSVLNSRMYCHSIATLAIAEAYAMTADPALRPAVLKAAQYSINAQDVRGGGWRYLPGDKGDLSQFGWQAMALRSVQRSGIQIPNEVQIRMRRFLDSCAAGRAGGLATYKPREGRPSNTMTAEALSCRLLLEYPVSPDALREAKSLIMSTMPGVHEDNVYYWYYATMALFQLQDQDWRTWNQALKSKLLTTQVPAYGQEPGSWDPDRMWGGYGGRVYATAMSCLCLEVYYRYLPMYGGSNLARGTATTPLYR